jgi:hypothetical protein
VGGGACGTKNIERRKKNWNEERGTKNEERRTKNAELGTRREERGTRNAERGMRNAEQTTCDTTFGTGPVVSPMRGPGEWSQLAAAAVVRVWAMPQRGKVVGKGFLSGAIVGAFATVGDDATLVYAAPAAVP